MKRLIGALLAAGLTGAQPFQGDPRWLGGDSAYSVDLGRGRVLWLFGDSFVASAEGQKRRAAKLVRNSIAIQDGYPLSQDSLSFRWGGTPDKPEAFFAAEQSGTWLWPGPGVRLGHSLLLFLMVLRPVEGGLGFETAGSTAWLIDNPDQPPDEWRHRVLKLPPSRHGVQVGLGALLVDGDELLAFSPVEPGSHDVYLIRWKLRDVRRGDLLRPIWHERPLFEGQTEFSVHKTRQGYAAVHSLGFGAAEVVMRVASEPEGPWSGARRVWQPQETDRPGILIYAAKAHPEQSGDGLMVTYCTNHSDFGTLLDDPSLYFPRVLRLPLVE